MWPELVLLLETTSGWVFRLSIRGAGDGKITLHLDQRTGSYSPLSSLSPTPTLHISPSPFHISPIALSLCRPAAQVTGSQPRCGRVTLGARLPTQSQHRRQRPRCLVSPWSKNTPLPQFPLPPFSEPLPPAIHPKAPLLHPPPDGRKSKRYELIVCMYRQRLGHLEVQSSHSSSHHKITLKYIIRIL